MWRYVLNRLLGLILILVATSVLTFTVLHLAPGDPVDIMFGPSDFAGSREQVPAEVRNQIRHQFGLNRPLPVQYVTWLGRIVRLDFGVSFRSHQPVAVELARRLPATATLALLAFGVEVVLALTFGVLSAVRAGSLFDHVVRLGSVVFVAMPSFWLGLLLLYVFSVQLQWVPIRGDASGRQVILPALTLGLVLAPTVMRVLRANIMTEMSRLYLVFGRAKGLSNRLLFWRHAFRNALLPAVTLLGMNITGLLSGTVIVETVFAWPGVGKYVMDSIHARDYPVVQGYVLLATVVVTVGNLLVDLTYTALDPRVRLGVGGNR